MDFEWDTPKAATNRRKHGVSFEEAEGAIKHPLAITVDDLEHSDDENREKTIGLSYQGRILIVIHTRRSENIRRIISARKAMRSEVIDYEKEIRQRLSQG